MFVTPNQESKQHLETNESDLSGTIYRSRNIDLDDAGYIKLASPSVSVMTKEDDSDLDTVDAMNTSDNDIKLNADEVFSGDMDMTTFDNGSSDTNRPTPSVEEDVIFFNDTEVVSDGTLVEYESSSNTWTTIALGMTTTVPTAMTVWETEGVCAVGNSNVVKFIKDDWSVHATTLTLPPDYQVSSLAVQGSQLFICTRSKSGKEAMMFVVSTIQVGIDYAYGVGCFEVSSVKPFKSSVVLLLVNGKLVRFNGGGFDTLAVLPIHNSGIEWGDASNDYSTANNRGMDIDGDKIMINISNETQDGKFRILPDFFAGVWCYDDRTGSLYHRYSPTWSQVQIANGASVTVDHTNDNFTLTSGNLDLIKTGMPMLFTDGSAIVIPELKQSTAYYVIKVSSTVFKLATSYANAVLGVAIDITGNGNVSQKFYFQLTNDYGFATYNNRMSLAVLNDSLFDDTLMGRICFSGQVYGKQSTSSLCSVNGISPFLPNRGWFSTPRLNSSAYEDEFTNAYIKHAPLQKDDLIILKYKDVEKLGYPFSSILYDTSENQIGTWVDTDTFTTTADLSAVIAGEEIEIISGVGSGHIAFVESISETTGTYTVNLVEGFPFAVVGDVMQFNVDNWKEAGRITVDTQKTGGGYRFPIGKKTKTLQVKVEMRGVKIKIEELIVNNKPFKLVV